MSSSLSRHRPQHLRLVENLLRRRGRSYSASSSSAFFGNSDNRSLSPDGTTTTTTTLHRHPQQQQQQQHRLFQYYENSTTRTTRHRQHDRSIPMFSTYGSHFWWHRHQQRSYCYFSSTPIRHSAEEVTVPPAPSSSSSGSSAMIVHKNTEETASGSAPPTSSKPQQTKLKPPPSPSSSNHDATSSEKTGKKNPHPRQQQQPKDEQATNNNHNHNKKKLNNKKPKATTRRKDKDDAAAVTAAAPPQLLQLRNVHARDTIEFHFEQVAMRTELSKLKFISKLRDKLLVLQLQQEEDEQESSANNNNNNSSSQNGSVADDNKSQNKNKKSTTNASPTPLSCWKVTQQYLDGRKSVPTHVKNAFWNLIVAPTHKKKNKKFPSEAIAAKDIEVLVEARDAAVQQPLFWNHKHKHQVSKQLVVEAAAAAAAAEDNLNTNKKQLQKDMLAEYLATRSKRISDLHHGTKSSKVRTDEARQMAQTLRSHLPPSYYQKLLTKLKEYVKQQQQQQQQLQGTQSPKPETTITATAPATTSTGTEGQQKTPTSFSASSLHTSAHTHFHLIAPILMDFFYLTLVDSDSGSGSEPTDPKDGDKSDANFEYGSTTTILSSDATLQSAEEAWREAREEFVSAFQTIQTILVEEHEQKFSQQTGSASDVAAVSAVDQEQDDALNDETAVVDWSINDDDDDDEDELGEVFGEDDDDDGFDAEEGEETEERVYDASEESVMATFEEAIKVLPGNEAAKATLLKPRHYIVFEAISVGDLSANPQEPHLYQSTNALEQASEVAKAAAAIQAAPTDQLVFIDNLPIDISENTLMDAYSRCGPIEAIQIHHQRPDLDPGRKSEDSKKKIRKPSRARMTWQRPRTPLYGTILFRDPAGAQKATVDPLRIFGMVLDKHLIRSYRASDMTKLYLEDISKQHDITYIEYQLSQILHPSLYVCLDIERRRQKKIRGPSSCEIKFPDFESAHWAYTKLSADLDLLKENDDCGLHWMPTPREAVLYWTRHLNF